MPKPQCRLAIRLPTILLIVTAFSTAGCREEAQPSAAPLAENASGGIEQPNADEIAAAVTKAVDSAKSGGSSAYVSGPDGTVSGSFAMPGAENVNIGVSTSSKAGMATASITVTFAKAEPLLLTPAAFAAIKIGMDYPQVAQAIGGEMTKGRLGDRYTGEFFISQAGRRIELGFKNGKVESKKSKGIE